MNYYFKWVSHDKGYVQGIHEQVIYGKTFSAACEYFEQFHGCLTPDANGFSVTISEIKVVI